MEDIKIGNGSISIWAIVAAVGGLIAFIGLFLACVKVTEPGLIKDVIVKISGLDFISNKFDGEKIEGDGYSFYRFMPLLWALTGLATLVLSILPIFGVKNNGIQIAAIVCGVLTFVFGLLMMIGCSGVNIFTGDTKDVADAFKFKVSAQIGTYFGLIGGLLAGAGACCDKFLKL